MIPSSFLNQFLEYSSQVPFLENFNSVQTQFGFPPKFCAPTGHVGNATCHPAYYYFNDYHTEQLITPNGTEYATELSANCYAKSTIHIIPRGFCFFFFSCSKITVKAPDAFKSHLVAASAADLGIWRARVAHAGSATPSSGTRRTRRKAKVKWEVPAYNRYVTWNRERYTIVWHTNAHAQCTRNKAPIDGVGYLFKGTTRAVPRCVLKAAVACFFFFF